MRDRLRVLLVDDDEVLGRSLARSLQWSRLDVVPCTGVAALTLLRMEPVDVVATDFALHDRHGLGLLDDVAALAPRAGRVLFGASVPQTVVDAALRRRRIHAFLRTPFSGDDLVAAAATAAGRAGVVDEGHPLTVH